MSSLGAKVTSVTDRDLQGRPSFTEKDRVLLAPPGYEEQERAKESFMNFILYGFTWTFTVVCIMLSIFEGEIIGNDCSWNAWRGDGRLGETQRGLRLSQGAETGES